MTLSRQSRVGAVMVTAAIVGNAAPSASRRSLYRQSKRLLVRLLSRRCKGPRDALEPTVRRFLRATPRSYLSRLIADRAFALAAAASLLVCGTAGALPPIELSDVADESGDPPLGFVINGINIYDFSGRSVSGAGDVNGDGFADVIVGAYLARPGGRFFAGESYVVFGKEDKAEGTAVNLAAVALGNGGFVINGNLEYDFSGFSVSGAGDVNGDGLADLIVGAPGADPIDPFGSPNFFAGESYVVFGKADTTPVELSNVAAGIGGFVINGIEALDYSGWSVSDAGDVNGDDLADVIVGAPFADPTDPFGDTNNSAGKSYVVFGKMDDTLPVNLADIALGTGGFVINGIDLGDNSGISVSGAGDVNRDCLADVIVGAPFADPRPGEPNSLRAGRSFVVFGKMDDTLPVNLADIALGTGGFVINGIDSFDDSGRSVSGADDVNGDGLADLIVGAPRAGPNERQNAGESYVVFGKEGKAEGTPVNLADVALGIGGFVMNGIDPSDFSGFSVSGAGDVNGDNMADLIVGALLAEQPGGRLFAGESYVVFGKADTTPVNLSDIANDTGEAGGFVINGIDLSDYSGFSVSGAGDVNGDGVDDVIVGAYGADPGGIIFAGESYVVFSPVVVPPRICAPVVPSCDVCCPEDCQAVPSGSVDVPDLVALIGAWGGPQTPGTTCDLDGSGAIGVLDLLALLRAWGPCPLPPPGGF